ncbi:MAG: hypothetical protein JNJ88_02980 [Planctomycetes bacterium]|nr:hypothetical protein [Planctomycetota bacterium]
MRAITNLKGARQLGDEIRPFLEAQLSDVEPSVHRGLQFVFEEVAANPMQHSKSPQAACGPAQEFPIAGRTQIAFASCGLRFRRSLQRNPELQGRVNSGADVIQLAVEEGGSGMRGHRKRGLGLHALRNPIDRLRGDVWIHLGDVLCTVAGKRAALATPTPSRVGWGICIDTPIAPHSAQLGFKSQRSVKEYSCASANLEPAALAMVGL